MKILNLLQICTELTTVNFYKHYYEDNIGLKAWIKYFLIYDSMKKGNEEIITVSINTIYFQNYINSSLKQTCFNFTPKFTSSSKA